LSAGTVDAQGAIRSRRSPAGRPLDRIPKNGCGDFETALPLGHPNNLVSRRRPARLTPAQAN